MQAFPPAAPARDKAFQEEKILETVPPSPLRRAYSAFISQDISSWKELLVELRRVEDMGWESCPEIRQLEEPAGMCSGSYYCYLQPEAGG